jgi:hypothetical protein
LLCAGLSVFLVRAVVAAAPRTPPGAHHRLAQLLSVLFLGLQAIDLVAVGAFLAPTDR